MSQNEEFRKYLKENVRLETKLGGGSFGSTEVKKIQLVVEDEVISEVDIEDLMD